MSSYESFNYTAHDNELLHTAKKDKEYSANYISKSQKHDEVMKWKHFQRYQGAVSIRKTVLPGMAIPMLKIRRPNGRLIFNMEIAIRR